jgi:hypothetical protein
MGSLVLALWPRAKAVERIAEEPLFVIHLPVAGEPQADEANVRDEIMLLRLRHMARGH